MNSSTIPRSSRASLAVAMLQLGGMAVAATLLAGCGRRPIIVNTPAPTIVQTTAPAPTSTVGTRDVIVVKEAPPPPRDEPPPPPPPSSQYTWVPGYWTARDGHQEWVPGRYEMPPRSGATWVAPRWERRSEGYVFVEGYWR